MAAAAPAITMAENGARRAAILLITLGEDLSAALLKEMAPEEVEAIIREVARIGVVSENERREVVESFLATLSDGNTSAVGGMRTAQKLLEKAFGPESAGEIMGRLSEESSLQARIEERFRDVASETLAQFLVREHPQAIAVFLAVLAPARASEVLAALPTDIRAEVGLRLAATRRVSPQLAEKVAAAIERRSKSAGLDAVQPFEGFKGLATLCNHLPPQITEEILAHVEQEDNTLAELVRNSMFTFEDIRRLDPATMALAMPRLERKTLTIALKGATEEIKERFLQTMSQRARAMLLEDIEALGPVRVRAVQEAQAQIAAVIRELDRSGVISVRGGAADGFVG